MIYVSCTRCFDFASSEVKRSVSAKYGFDAYAVASDNPDPVASAMGVMVEHIHAMDERIVELCQVIQTLGGNINTDKLEGMSEEDFACTGLSPVAPKTQQQKHEAFDPHI